ncbi:alpha-amylase family glycosyl hydrolase [Siphonobacter sp. SORGH_AS_1065]|nr:alpha-amylase family glycosyl hydrolase [Siphonobacter sp. SORGH_AS_1065]MDQ1088895.1 glycosidase [Siphonobacter sp. SORGH_AS_1065]
MHRLAHRWIVLTCLLFCLAYFAEAQGLKVDHINPTNWFVGMKNQQLQLLMHGPNLKGTKVKVNYPGVFVERVQTVDNPNYILVDLTIAAAAKPGTVQLQCTKIFPLTEKRQNATVINGGREITITIPYELKARTAKPQTVSSQDFVYLLLPDRFANGDPTNDRFSDMADTQSDRTSPFLRHGGDLQGITKHLDYFRDLGVTTLWLNPVIENDQALTDEGGTKRSAYHGYAFTDHYNVDKRLGGNEAYLKLIQSAHAKGLKIMQDAVYNHVGNRHWIVRDLPAKDWLNQWPQYQNTTYKDQPVVDPYASEQDRKISQDGWFTSFLPDWNHKNPFVANFLIQHALWTVEYFGIDAWRVDTYFYNNLEFMNTLNQRLLDEHPNLYICGESWVNNVPNQAYFAKNKLNVPWKSNLPGAIDFQLYFATNESLNQSNNRWYEILGQDILYDDAFRNLIFLDNHDLDRYFSVIGEDLNKYKMGITFLLTTRGIPQLYYGTEILMKNFKNPSDAEVRKDFPGGFPNDPSSKFTAEGRTSTENEAYSFVRTLARYRQQSTALQTGKLTHFLPQDGIYAYFRHDSQGKVMVLLNPTKDARTVQTDRFSELLNGVTSARNVMTGASLPSFKQIQLSPWSSLVLELH